MSTRIPILVPDLGLESEEIKFGAWLKQAGESVLAGEDLFEIESDKATVICESETGGVLSETVVTEGLVKTGDVLGYIETA